VLLFAAGLWLIWDGYDRRNWVRADGKVLSSDVSTSFSLSDFKFRFRPVVTFEYVVDEKTFRVTATAATWNHRREDLVGAAGAAMDYPEGSVVGIFHRRDNPARAALKPEPRNWHIWLLAVGLAAAIGGVSLLRSKRADSTAPVDSGETGNG
jgi:hypothetical protein